MNGDTNYSLEIGKHADRIFRKLQKRDKMQLEAINEKVRQVLANPHHFKPLSGDMHAFFFPKNPRYLYKPEPAYNNPHRPSPFAGVGSFCWN
jgi:hypothetical protein